MKRTNQNGSLAEPKLSSLKFRKPFSKDGSRKQWHFEDFRDKSGIYVIKEDKQVVKIGFAIICLKKSILAFFGRNKEYTEDKMIVASVRLPKDKVMPVCRNLREEVLKIPIDNMYREVKTFLKSKKEVPVSLFDFHPPFLDSRHKDNERVCFYKRRKYFNRSGVYVIKENDVIVYVGMAYKTIYTVMYHHFYPYMDDPEKQVYRVDYSDLLDVNDYQIALIDIPSFGKTKDEERKEVLGVESYLIKQWQPRDNRKGIEENQAVLADSGYHYDLIPTPDDDIPF